MEVHNIPSENNKKIKMARIFGVQMSFIQSPNSYPYQFVIISRDPWITLPIDDGNNVTIFDGEPQFMIVNIWDHSLFIQEELNYLERIV